MLMGVNSLSTSQALASTPETEEVYIESRSPAFMAGYTSEKGIFLAAMPVAFPKASPVPSYTRIFKPFKSATD